MIKYLRIGSARIDEHGHASGGSSGDQKQSGSGTDKKGEVSIQDFYIHNKGWIVLRPKKISHAKALKKSMKTACNNINIGYDQSNRLGIMKDGTNSKVPTECDCSSLVRRCVKEATGIDPGDFYTGNEVVVLEKTKLFQPSFIYQPGMAIYMGDILVTKTKGHTVIVTSGYPLECSNCGEDIRS